MEWIATAALVAISISAMSMAWDFAAFTRAFIEFINRPARIINTSLILSPQIEALLTSFRRYKPREKKETVA